MVAQPQRSCQIISSPTHHGLLALGSRVRLLGFQTHEKLMQEAKTHHAYLAPSITSRRGDTEGGAPVCIIEMLASGMNIISTRHCDIPEIIKHGETGWLADEGDMDGLVEAIRQMILARDQWPSMQGRGRDYVDQNFNSSVQAAQLALTYRELTGEMS